MENSMRKYLVVVDRKDGSYATSMDITDMSPAKLDRLENGLYRKVDFDHFYVEVIESENPPEVKR